MNECDVWVMIYDVEIFRRGRGRGRVRVLALRQAMIGLGLDLGLVLLRDSGADLVRFHFGFGLSPLLNPP